MCKDTENAFTEEVVSQTGAGDGVDVSFNDVESEEDKGNFFRGFFWQIGFKEGTEFAKYG